MLFTAGRHAALCARLRALAAVLSPAGGAWLRAGTGPRCAVGRRRPVRAAPPGRGRPLPGGAARLPRIGPRLLTRSPGAMMCLAIALPVSELPVELVEAAGLSARVHNRGGEKEVRFYWRAVPAPLARVVGREVAGRAVGEPGPGRAEAAADRVDVAGDSRGGEVVGAGAGAGGRAGDLRPHERGLVPGKAGGAGAVWSARAAGEPVVFTICEPSDAVLPGHDPRRVDAGPHRRGHLNRIPGRCGPRGGEGEQP